MCRISVVFKSRKDRVGRRVSPLPHCCDNYESAMFTAAIGTGYPTRNICVGNPLTTIPSFMVTVVNDHFSSSSSSHSTSTQKNSDHIVVNLYFLLNMIHVIQGKYDPASIKILKKKKKKKKNGSIQNYFPSIQKKNYSYFFRVKSISNSFSSFIHSFAVVSVKLII